MQITLKIGAERAERAEKAERQQHDLSAFSALSALSARIPSCNLQCWSIIEKWAHLKREDTDVVVEGVAPACGVEGARGSSVRQRRPAADEPRQPVSSRGAQARRRALATAKTPPSAPSSTPIPTCLP